MDNEVTMYTADGLDILYHSGMISEEEYLAHHGILGQKWGIRRYQNPDGSLTEEGRKKYSSSKEAYYDKKAYKAGIASVLATAVGAADISAPLLGYAWYNRYKQKQEAKKAVFENDETQKKTVAGKITFDQKKNQSILNGHEKTLSAMFKEQWHLEDKYNETNSKKDRTAADRKSKEIDDFIENVYAKDIYDSYQYSDPVIVNKKTGDMKMWSQVLDSGKDYTKDFNKLTRNDKNKLVTIENGTNGLYRKFDSKIDDISKAEKVEWDEYVEWERNNNP